MANTENKFWIILSVASCVVAATSALAADESAQKQPSSPKEVCNAIVEATKKDDFKTVQQWSYGWQHGHHHQAGEAAGKHHKGQKHSAKKTEKEFHSMRSQYMSKLKDMQCGSETIADDHAFVQAEAEGSKRLIPFIQKDGKWLFDAHSYMSFYREDIREAKSQKKQG